jgi:15-cis-phytoene desaturase
MNIHQHDVNYTSNNIGQMRQSTTTKRVMQIVVFIIIIMSPTQQQQLPAFVLKTSHPKRNMRRTHRRMADYKKPNVENTDGYRYSNELSRKFRTLYHVDFNRTDNNNSPNSIGRKRKKVIIVGGGLSGLACGKYITDAGHEAIVYEARNVLGGKVSAWQDDDGDWIETGLHIFFGAYPNMMNLLSELSIEDRLQWKKHQMIFARRDIPGEFTSFDFIPNLPAPFHFALAILMNTKMLTIVEKIQMIPALLPMLLRGQDFIDEQDQYSVLQYMKKYGMPDRINDEIFISMAKALDFINPDKLSMAVILTAMNRFINEMNGSQCAFLDGNPPERLCEPIQQYIEQNGGKVYTNSPIQEIVTNPNGSIQYLLLRNGEKVMGDEYVSAVPVDIIKRLIPMSWQSLPYFRQLDELEGIPGASRNCLFDINK